MGRAVTFFLGTHIVNWLGKVEVPLFVSARRLRYYKEASLPRALFMWGLDSGAFSEILKYGDWRTGVKDYVEEVRRWRDAIGNMVICAPQDWMCEPEMVKRTGLTVEMHQRLTTLNYVELREAGPELPFFPVLQGWSIDDYMRHVELYDEFGVCLEEYPLVGVGSVCRRQHTDVVLNIFRSLDSMGLALHGFGVKTRAIGQLGRYMISADSMAWSVDARRTAPLVGCKHKSCANCLRYALLWRKKIVAKIHERTGCGEINTIGIVRASMGRLRRGDE